MVQEDRLGRLRVLVKRQGRLISLPSDRTTVFVGDTHGDRDAAERVLDRFPLPQHVLVFLGDYVDRGPDSLGNLTLLLEAKLAHPDCVFLLMGNHEAWTVTPFSPADFWQAMPREEEKRYGDTFIALPFAAWHPAGILALHGALPDVGRIEDIARIELGSADWRKITWGDWADVPGYGLGSPSGRPTFGADYFDEVAFRLGMRVLVRAHQPSAPTFLYGDRCLTLFTSRAYEPTPRQVAVFRPGRSPRSARDLDLVRI
jgi:hypothetical protein